MKPKTMPPLITLRELMKKAERGNRRTPTTCGRWQYDEAHDTIDYIDDACRIYVIPNVHAVVQNRQEMGEWLLHIAEKAWARRRDIGDLASFFKRIGSYLAAKTQTAA